MSKKAEIGLRLQYLRERLGMKQNQLAQALDWSPARLSRVETGERELADAELESLTAALGTPEAIQLQSAVERTWGILSRPQIGHPDENLLWEAEQALQQLAALAAQDGLKSPFIRRIDEFQRELHRMSERIHSIEHRVAFVGAIGVGKSTAICRIAGLEVTSESSPTPSTILEVGAGGVTICDVHVRKGPGVGILVDPRSSEDIQLDVTNFAESLIRNNTSTVVDDQDQNETDWGGVSKEITRAIRNMAELTTTRELGADGKFTRTDRAKNLANGFNDTSRLTVELLNRMGLHARTRRDIWYPLGSAQTDDAGKIDAEALSWLKETFEQINNGRHPEFSLPERIEVVIPSTILRHDDLSISLVDTKGIDHTAERSDLERNFHDDQTVVVLCSAFNDAPSMAAVHLLDRAIESGVRDIEKIAGILVLPRPEEALAAKDDLGYTADTASDGYILKSEQLEDALNPKGLDLTRHFFNAREDDVNQLLSFLTNLVEGRRDSQRDNLRESVKGALNLVSNVHQEQANEVQREAANHLNTWLSSNKDLPTISPFLRESLMQALRDAHPSTLSASIRRTGRWYNLEYGHQLGHGARKTAVRSVGTKFDDFRGVATNLLNNPDLSEAHDLVRQTLRIMENGIDEIFRKTELLGQTVHEASMKRDSGFWARCDAEWGMGPGYKHRVTEHNSNWFDDDKNQIHNQRIEELVESEWGNAVARVGALLELEA